MHALAVVAGRVPLRGDRYAGDTRESVSSFCILRSSFCVFSDMDRPAILGQRRFFQRLG
jgi:hypothetical protein